MNKLPITIGIPAYNEQANIGNLLACLLTQQQDDFVIKEIIVVSDGSTDNTGAEVENFQDPRIKLLTNAQRKGQPYCQNLIFKNAGSDLVALFEADTLPCTDSFLAGLVKIILRQPEIGIVQGNFRPLAGETFTGRVLQKQAQSYNQVSLKSSHVVEWSCSGRSGRLFNKQLLKNFVWPVDVPEDAYAALWCFRQQVPQYFCAEVCCFYACAQNFTDFVKQRQKNSNAAAVLEKYFSKQEIKKIYNRNFLNNFLMLLAFAAQHPLYFLAYATLKARLAMQSTHSKFTDYWDIAKSTKSVARRPIK